ncbi:MAG: aminotransferase class I/II-fold pyridoxal phosphate-dependent enzyme [Coxiellaceae bacterium]|nr:aminotransferase class I/II-fold pyridoxal phosphate-dependent enzyme [Coxiellaceae bacterium]
MAKLSLNPQLAKLSASATLAINQQVMQLRQEGQNVYHWGFGQSPFPVPELIVRSLQRNADKKQYLPSLGLAELRDAVAEYYLQEFNFDIEGSQVVIGPGSKELIYNLLYLIPGELLLPAPSWVSYAPQAQLLGKPYRYIQTDSANSYCLTADELEQACQQSQVPGTKMLILNSPNNPTGTIYSQQNLEQLTEVCRRHNVLVISDEIYAKVEFNHQFSHSLAHCYPEGTLVTAGLSKLFGAGGYRLGVCIVPDNLTSTLMAPWSTLISETFSCVSAPIQYAAVTAYQNFDQLRDGFTDRVAIQKIASETIYQCLVDNHIDCPRPQGAFYLMPDFKPHQAHLAEVGVTDSNQLALWLLQHASIAALPGSAFGMPAEQLCLRIAAVDFDGGKALDMYQNDRNIDPKQFAQQALPDIVAACQQLSALMAKNDTIACS